MKRLSGSIPPSRTITIVACNTSIPPDPEVQKEKDPRNVPQPARLGGASAPQAQVVRVVGVEARDGVVVCHGLKTYEPPWTSTRLRNNSV